MIRASLLFPVLLTVILLPPAARAADGAANGGDEKGLTVALDQAKLTAWVLEEFPDGLPFDRTGRPTDAKQAQKFWQLIADWPISLNGPVTELLPAINAISQEAGLPIEFGMDASKRLSNADSKMKMFTINDSVQKTIRIICRSAGVDKTVVTPGGLLVLGPDDPEDPEEVVAATPKNAFRWRENAHAKFKKAFPDGYDSERATAEEQDRAAKIILESRCDLIVTEKTEVRDFINWLAQASDISFTIDPTAFLPAEPAQELPDPQTPEDHGPLPLLLLPLHMRFCTYGQALEEALEGTGLACVGMEGPGLLIAPAKPKNTFRWREDWRDKVQEGAFSGGTLGEGTPDEWVHLWDTILDTRCDLVVAQGLGLREFLTWLSSEAQLNLSVHRFTFYASQMSLDEMHKLLGELPDDVDYGELIERDMAEPHPPSTPDFARVPRKTKPVALRNVTVREALNTVLADFDLMVMAGSIGQIRVVPKGLTKEELEQLRRQDVESWRSDTDSSHQEEESHD